MAAINRFLPDVSDGIFVTLIVLKIVINNLCHSNSSFVKQIQKTSCKKQVFINNSMANILIQKCKSPVVIY